MLSDEFSTWKSENRESVDDLISDCEQSLQESLKRQDEESGEFRKAQTDRFNALHRKRSQDVSDLLKEQKEAVEKARTEETEKAQAHLTSISDLEKEARNLLGLIGNTAVTGNYQKIADQERKIADMMRYISFASIGIAGLLALFIVWCVNTNDFNWEVALFRLLVGVPFIGLAVYCARESSRHRTNEERNRRIELELTALEPYLYQLPQDKAREIREALTDKYFGNGTGDLSKAEGHRLVVNFKETMKQLDPFIELMKKLAK